MTTCTVDGCEKPGRRPGPMCEMHYYRLRRRGTLEVGRPQRERRGTCIVDGCGKPDCSPRGYCKMHETRLRRHGDLLTVKSPPHPAGPAHPSWQGADVTYSAAHERLRSARGSPLAHPCVDCGEPAAHWCYDHLDPAERSSTEGPYSVDPAHYDARCVPCHKRYDLRVIAARPRR